MLDLDNVSKVAQLTHRLTVGFHTCKIIATFLFNSETFSAQIRSIIFDKIII